MVEAAAAAGAAATAGCRPSATRGAHASPTSCSQAAAGEAGAATAAPARTAFGNGWFAERGRALGPLMAAEYGLWQEAGHRSRWAARVVALVAAAASTRQGRWRVWLASQLPLPASNGGRRWQWWPPIWRRGRCGVSPKVALLGVGCYHISVQLLSSLFGPPRCTPPLRTNGGWRMRHFEDKGGGGRPRLAPMPDDSSWKDSMWHVRRPLPPPAPLLPSTPLVARLRIDSSTPRQPVMAPTTTTSPSSC